MTLTKTGILLAAAIAPLALTGAAEAQVLRFSTEATANDLDAIALRAWEAYIEENSDLEVEVFDSASLVEQGRQGQALSRGTVDAAYMAPSWIAEQVPQWLVLDTPYLLTGPDHICAFAQSDMFDQMVAEVQEEMGILLLAPAYQGTRTLNLREQRDVMVPADMEGMSIRVVPSPSNILMGEGLGGNPTPVPFAELYLALQTGTVDAQENPLTIIYANQLYEVTEQIVTTNHKALIQFPSISMATWDRLSEEDRQVVLDGAEEAMAVYTQTVIDQEASLRETMEGEGMIFTDPDREVFRSNMLEMFQNSELAEGWSDELFQQIADLDIPDDCRLVAN